MNPQVLAVDVQYSQLLLELFELIEKSVVEFGLPAEKKSTLHILRWLVFKEGQVPKIDVSLATLKCHHKS